MRLTLTDKQSTMAGDGERRELISDLFHALNQPLTTLRCSLELALQQPRTAKQYRDGLSVALKHAEQIAWLATGIRELLEADDADDDRQVLALEVCLQEAVVDLLPVAETAGVRLSFRRGSPCRVFFEPRRLAKLLNEYRASMQSPTNGAMLHNGSGECMDMDKLAQRVIRPAVEAIGLPWFGWHGFRRGLSYNLYELGANEKIVQRILRHANPHVTNDRYIKAFDPAVPEAMQRMQAAAGVLEKRPAPVQRRNLKGKW